MGLLVGLLWQAIGVGLAGAAVVARQGQPAVNARIDVLEAGSVAAKLAGSEQRAVAGLLRSRSAKARASALEMQVEQLVLQSQTKTSVLEDMSSQATAQSDKAEVFSSNAVKAFKGMQAKAKTMPAEAAQLAAVEVQHLFESNFDALDGWRQGVLQDRSVEATAAAEQAAVPYRRASAAFVKRIQAYTAEALATAKQSNEAAARAGEIAQGAKQRQAQGDVMGASQDMELARATMQQARQLSQYAKALKASADKMQAQTGLYADAESMAAAQASNAANPNAMPPLMLDPNTAYTPPPMAGGAAPGPAPGL